MTKTSPNSGVCVLRRAGRRPLSPPPLKPSGGLFSLPAVAKARGGFLRASQWLSAFWTVGSLLRVNQWQVTASGRGPLGHEGLVASARASAAHGVSAALELGV